MLQFWHIPLQEVEYLDISSNVPIYGKSTALGRVVLLIYSVILSHD
jgi:hypothetical protein